MDDDAARLGPDLVDWLRNERITVFCPPPTQLRAMACADPARELPDLRLLYVGGEALPQDLADTWAAACWLENGYGPTECTVTVVRGRMRPGAPVTIGQPVEGHRAFLLDDQLRPVAEGEAGELCIAGPGLARGYLNQPDLTAARFPVHPEYGRIYRTGDLVQRDGSGNLRCLGRIDTQIKLRGYRIELEAIEATLAACEGVRQAACRVAGAGSAAQLVAFLVPRVAASPPTPAALRSVLGARLPPYMVPARFMVVASLPTTLGGKLDRRALPEVGVELGTTAPAAARRPPRDAVEAQLAQVFANFLPPGDELSVDDDFFDRGGDSLGAARVISVLRSDPTTAALTVRDIYTARTVAGLAAKLRAAAPLTAGPPVIPVRGGAARPGLVTTLQVLVLVAGLVLTSGLLYLLGFAVLPHVVAWLGPALAALLFPLALPLLWWAYLAFAVAVAVIAKRALIGRYAPGRVPVWSGLYLRHWIVQRCARLVPWGSLQGTELHCVVLRLLGARIGCDVHIHRGVDLGHGGWDLLALGDGVTLAQDASLLVAALADGHVVFAPVTIGAGSTIDVRACVDGGAELGRETFLAASAWLPGSARVPDGARCDGVPATIAGAAPAPTPLPDEARELAPARYTLALLAARGALRAVVTLPTFGLAALLLATARVDAATALAWLTDPWSAALPVVATLAVVALPLTLGLEALLARWLAPRRPGVQPGVMPRRSALHVRTQLATGLVDSAGEWLSGTLFWPAWLRLAGMRLGANCEISTITDVVPRHVSIGGETFFADGIYLASPRIHRGVVTLPATSLGKNTFLGNHVVVPAGQHLPDDLLLGVSTVADDATMRTGTGWFGHPPFELPRREVVAADRRLTHEPDFLRWSSRVCFEALRFLLPVLPIVFGWWWYATVAAQAAEADAWHVALVVVPQATFGVAAAMCLLVLALKWALLGRVRPGQHALWSGWCNRWDFLYVVWNRFARPLLTTLEGTLLLPWYLRAMGASIGRRTVLGTGFAQLVDPDMIHIEDGATVDAQFQAHSFEDRVLKIDRLYVRAGATVGHGVVLLYGADVGAGAHVAPHAVVMKHERLPPHQRYEGFPIRAVAPHTSTTVVLPDLPTSTDRNLTVDAARGLAVLCMMIEHFVPTEGGEGPLELTAAAISRFAYGKSAPLFCMLLGLGMALAAQRGRVPWSHWLRRALGLLVLGQLFAWAWTTEILMPLGLMTLLCAPLLTRSAGLIASVAIALLAVTPVLGGAFAAAVETDWLEDGSHLRDHGFGWATVRYFLIDGNYPLVPWLAFALVGVWLARVGWGSGRRAGGHCVLALALALAIAAQAYALWAGTREELDPAWASTWVPTSIPFVLVGLSWAMVAITALQLSQRVAPRALAGLALLGRTSLTHYLGHIVLAYAGLRLLYGSEEWSVTAGVAGMVAYLACAWPATVWMLRRAQRGPAEALLAWLAGRTKG
jgi:non-ribosomal peptide synthetase-like protein